METPAKTKDFYTRPGSSTHFVNLETEKTFEKASDLATHTPIKPSTSPHVTKVVVIVIIGVLIVAAVVTVAVVLATKDKDDDDDNVASTTTTTAAVSPPITSAPMSDGSTTSTNPPVESTSTQPSQLDLWSNWGPWTECTATCGNGIYKRYRQCNGNISTDCTGEFVETSVCSTTACPVYGSWTTWAAWQSCGVTCGGGTQTRTRTCVKASDDDIDCVGLDSQAQSCSNWSCPDCNQACQQGILNAACTICECSSYTVEGRVLAETTGNPIQEAVISSFVSPTTILDTSSSTGSFVLQTVCSETTIIVSRDGFVDTIVEVTSQSMDIYMTKIEYPHLTQTPVSKQRLTGESVTLCCSAVANPDILYYEWFKDSLLVNETHHANGGHLILNDLGLAETGQYKCRANSAEGAIMSTAALLSVKGNPDDFCIDALQQHTITLPYDCIQPATNTSTYNVGKCEAKSCRTSEANDTGTCGEETPSCCVVNEAIIETVQCSGYKFSVIVVKSCTCDICSTNSLTVTGTVVSFDNESPVKYVEIYINGQFETYASRYGKFDFDITTLVSSLTLTFRDAEFNQFLPAIKTLDISHASGGTIDIVVKMIRIAEPILIQSSEETSLHAGSSPDNSSRFDINIPSNSFYFPNGTEFTGTVSARFTYLDPTNSSVVPYIPGQFQFVDEEGESANLESLGVFSLSFKDTDGNSLILNETIDVYIPTEPGEYNTNKEFKLWSLDSNTGLWQELVATTTAQRRRKKRQLAHTLVGEITSDLVTDYEWYNVDAVWYLYDNNELCYFKTHLFKDAQLTETVSDPGRYIDLEISMYNDISQTLRTLSGYVRHPTYECIPVGCDGFVAHISAYYWYYGQEVLFVAEPVINPGTWYDINSDENLLQIELNSSSSGPFYDDEQICINSEYTDNHLRFHYGFVPSGRSIMYKFLNDEPASFTRSQRQNLSQHIWYPNRGLEGYKVCNAKVKITFDRDLILFTGQFLKLRVQSFGGTFSAIAGTLLGLIDYDIPTNNSNVPYENQTICIEYKCSGIADAKYDPDNSFDFTFVHISLTYPTVGVYAVVTQEATSLVDVYLNNTQMNSAQLNSIDGAYTFYAPDIYGPDYGLYSATNIDHNKINDAQTVAQQKCLTGQQDNAVSNDIGIAVSFEFRSDVPWYYYWF